MTTDRNIYFKIAAAAAKVFTGLGNIEKRTYTAAELGKYTSRNKRGEYTSKYGDALMFRNALSLYKDEHPDEVHTITDGTFECTLPSDAMWEPLAEFEKLARIPKSEQVKFVAKSKADILYKLTATLPTDAALAKKYVADKRSIVDPRFRVAYIDIKNGWLWASTTYVFYGGRCDVTLTHGDADMLALPTELATKYAGQMVDITYYEDGTIECGEDTISMDNSSQFLGKCSFIKAVPKVSTEAKITLDKAGMDKLRKFLKTGKSARAAVDAIDLSVDGNALTASYKDENDKRCVARMELPDTHEHQHRAAFDRTQLLQVLSDCNGVIWLGGRDRATIFDMNNANSFVMAMPVLTEDTKEYNDNIERKTDYLTIKNKSIMAKKVTETPLMKQYAEMKRNHPDALLLFRIGDFYETLSEDAVAASEILGITLSRRVNGQGGYVEIAGFPYHALDTYLPKLVRAGKRVAICEQFEDSKQEIKEEVEAFKPAEPTPEPQPKPAEPEPTPEPTLKDELRECALAQLPQGAEIVAAKYIPIGDDNGKWQLILKKDGVYRYADIVGKARYLYVCDRTFFTTSEVAALMDIPLVEQPTEPEPTEPEPAETAATPDEIPFEDEPKAPTDTILEMKKMFMDEYGKSDEEAIALAEDNHTLRRKLETEKSVEFRFRKKDGSIRIAHGTLHPDVIPETKGDRKPNPKMQMYWDLDKQAWRWFDRSTIVAF